MHIHFHVILATLVYWSHGFSSFHAPLMEYLDESSFTGPAPPTGPIVQVQSISCSVPGSCTEGLWTLLLGGVETQTEVAPDRWDISVYYTVDPDASSHGKTNAKHGAFLSSEELMNFDSTFFKMKSQEAAVMVPEQRLTLRLGTTCLLEAGFSLTQLQGCMIDTYVGDCSSESRNYVTMNPFQQRGTASGVTANRLAYCLGLRGESCGFDTACSSSLVALSHAHGKLRSSKWGVSERPGAVIVGVRVLLGPDGFVGLGAGGFLGIHGRCLTFDSSANGFGRGEGCSSVFLSPTDEEMELATLLGSAVNQDGRSASLTAPNGPSQQSCIRESLGMAGISAASLTSLECHGTGTSLGDPIEIGAIRGVLGDTNFRAVPMLTSSKSNLGHAEAAAGLNGFVKCVLMLVHSMCPANVHLRVLNGNLDAQGFPCLFGNEPIDAVITSQHVGVSSFGFGGTNARADLWGYCQEGPRAVSARFVSVPCLLCGRDMCKSCGEIADGFTLDFHSCQQLSTGQPSHCIECGSESDRWFLYYNMSSPSFECTPMALLRLGQKKAPATWSTKFDPLSSPPQNAAPGRRKIDSQILP